MIFASTTENLVGLGVAIAIAIYLVVVLIFPEKF